MARRWWRRSTEPTAQAANKEAHPDEEIVKQIVEALTEDPGETKEQLKDIGDAIAGLEKPHEHPLAVSPSDWHDCAVEAHGVDVPELGLDAFGGVLSAMLSGLGKGLASAVLNARYNSRQLALQRGQHLAQGLVRPIVVDPAVSFAPGSCCLVVIKPSGDLAVLPGGEGRAFKREHRGEVLGPRAARDWARQIRDKPDLRLSPEQADAITAWIDTASDPEPPRTGPTVIVISQPQAPPDTPDPARR